MVKTLQDKNNYSMFGKTQYENTLKLISKPDELNVWSKTQLINYKKYK